MYGRYTQELGVYAKEEAARLRESGQRRSISDRSRTLDLLEYEKGRCAKCRSKFNTAAATRGEAMKGALLPVLMSLIVTLLPPSTNAPAPLQFC